MMMEAESPSAVVKATSNDRVKAKTEVLIVPLVDSLNCASASLTDEALY